jgi:hypothetical protein
MNALISISTREHTDSCGRKTNTPIRAGLQQSYQRFVDWLMEPIPFPGKWPECNPMPQGYNRSEMSSQLSSEIQTDVS